MNDGFVKSRVDVDVGWIKERSDESTPCSQPGAGIKVLVDPLRLIHPTAYQGGGVVL